MRSAREHRPFCDLARKLHAIGHAIYCNESCANLHDDRGCEHESHCRGCPHSECYDFDWEPTGEVAERWSECGFASLIQFLSQLDCRSLSVEEIETRLEWRWRGDNRTLRRAMASIHRTRCVAPSNAAAASEPTAPVAVGQSQR